MHLVSPFHTVERHDAAVVRFDEYVACGVVILESEIIERYALLAVNLIDIAATADGNTERRFGYSEGSGDDFYRIVVARGGEARSGQNVIARRCGGGVEDFRAAFAVNVAIEHDVIGNNYIGVVSDLQSAEIIEFLF